MATEIYEADKAINLSTAGESAIINFCSGELEQELSSASAFAEHLEDIDEYVCTRGEMVEAIRMAPSKVIRQILYTEFRFREHIALITGRSFV